MHLEEEKEGHVRLNFPQRAPLAMDSQSVEGGTEINQSLFPM